MPQRRFEQRNSQHQNQKVESSPHSQSTSRTTSFLVAASRTPSSHAVVLERPEAALAERVLEREYGEDLDDAHVQQHDGPEGLERRLLVGDVGRHINITAEERVEVLRDGEAEGREHGHAAVLELALAEVLGALLRDLLP